MVIYIGSYFQSALYLSYLFSSLPLFIYRFSKYKEGKSREKRIIRYKKYHKHNKKYNRLYKLHDYSDTPYYETIMKLKIC